MNDGHEPREAETLRRLGTEIGWYRRHATRAMIGFHILKITQIVAGAALPVCSIAIANPDALRVTTGVLGACIAAIEGVLQLSQSDRNWQRWQSACEALKREQTLFLQAAQPYDQDDADANRRLCALRVEDIIAREHGGWVEQQTGLGKTQPAHSGGKTAGGPHALPSSGHGAPSPS